MDDLHREPLLPRPVRQARRPLAPGRDDHLPGEEFAFAGLQAPDGIVAIHAIHLHAQFDRGGKFFGIAFEVAHERVAAGKLPCNLWYRYAR